MSCGCPLCALPTNQGDGEHRFLSTVLYRGIRNLDFGMVTGLERELERAGLAFFSVQLNVPSHKILIEIGE